MATETNSVEVHPHALVIALQYWSGDEARAMRLARLIADIEPRRRDDVVFAFCRRFDQPGTALSWETSLYVGEKFAVMKIQSKREGVGHPNGPNELWSGTMEALAEARAEGRIAAHSVFTIEADGVPLRAKWIKDILAEHERTLETGKRVTGAEMRGEFRHLNGSLVAHLSLWADRPSLHRTPPGHAWDIHHAHVLMAEGRPTTAIRNIYGAGAWSAPSLRLLAREASWLSSSKDDSVLDWAERTLPRRVRRTEPERHYATVCHANQVEVLYQSMKRHCQPFVLHVLAWDWEAPFDITADRRGLRFISRETFLARHPGLLPLGGHPRNANETVCTIRWRFFCDVMEDTNQPVTAIDGDMMFFGDPEPVFEEIGDAPCAVTPHGFRPAAEGGEGVTLESHRKFGLHNAGWVYLADREAAEMMRTLTGEWVKIGWRKIDGREFFGDQGYLELLVERHGAHVIQNHAVNLGPWSARHHPIEARDGQIFVGGIPLIAYHFQSLKDYGGKTYRLADKSYELPEDYIEHVYPPYLKAIEEARRG